MITIYKIADFGASRQKSQESRMTQQVGTFVYMSPEVVLGEFYDEKTDVFSFGILMFELIVETLKPYGDQSNVQFKVARNPLFRPVFPESFVISPSQMFLVKLMTQCWNHDPAERPSFDTICSVLESKSKEGE